MAEEDSREKQTGGRGTRRQAGGRVWLRQAGGRGVAEAGARKMCG